MPPPPLAAADVSVAIGTGTDVALESAGVTLLRGDPNGIAHARQLSHAVMSNVRRGLVLAFGYNAAGIPIAVGQRHRQRAAAAHPAPGVTPPPPYHRER